MTILLFGREQCWVGRAPLLPPSVGPRRFFPHPAFACTTRWLAWRDVLAPLLQSVLPGVPPPLVGCAPLRFACRALYSPRPSRAPGPWLVHAPQFHCLFACIVSALSVTPFPSSKAFTLVTSPAVVRSKRAGLTVSRQHHASVHRLRCGVLRHAAAPTTKQLFSTAERLQQTAP